MKLSKQILEAVNRGIKLALDDFEDNEPIGSTSQHNDVIENDNDDLTKTFMMELNFVDLALPSGTLWYKYNLGVDYNKLDTPKDWYGDYYAWGETKTKDNYDYDGYKDNYYKEHQFTLNNDAAYQTIRTLNKTFHMCIPTTEQLDELIYNTENYWVKDYNGIVGLKGRIFKGKNGNKIFFPAAGYATGPFKGWYDTIQGFYWSSNSNKDKSWLADCFFFADIFGYNNGQPYIMDEKKYIGCSIRPVKCK